MGLDATETGNCTTTLTSTFLFLASPTHPFLLGSWAGQVVFSKGTLLNGIAAVQHNSVTTVSITKLGTMLKNGLLRTIAASVYFPYHDRHSG